MSSWLASADPLFSFLLRFFLVFSMGNDFQLYPGQFAYYVTRLWLLFTSCYSLLPDHDGSQGSVHKYGLCGFPLVRRRRGAATTGAHLLIEGPRSLLLAWGGSQGFAHTGALSVPT